MAEQSQTRGDFFSRLGKLLEAGCDYSESVIEDSLETLFKPGRRVNALLDNMAALSQTVIQNSPLVTEKLVENQVDLMSKQLELAESLFARLAGEESKPVIRPSITDWRFADESWEKNPLFDFIKQSYLLNSQALDRLVDCLGLDRESHDKITYCTRQLSSALSPTNFVLTNPEVLRAIAETKGENLINGIRQLIEDRSRSGDFLNVCMSDHDKFKLGENIATTPGKVIYENRMMQLIQYQATTSHVRETPLLMIPSWVNKYYILDLRQKNSFVKWAVDHGFTVFMISWVNPDGAYRNVGFDDYMIEGLLTAVSQVKEATGSERVNAMGYCLGGILLAATLAYMARTGDDSIASATYLTTSLDFRDPGEISVLIDELVLEGLQDMMDETGYLDGRTLAVAFSLLRENDLYWNYFVLNYLKGQRPSAFDILHWNSDSTNIPAATHKFVLNELHEQNGLMKRNQIKLRGKPLDMSKVKTPVYVLATEKDHIAKWHSTYSATQIQGGPVRFVLAGSGHIAGVVNPPAANKYHYYINRHLPADPDDWLDGAFKHTGSWWNDWYRWTRRRSGTLTEARTIDPERVIEDAPGRYVKVRLDDVKHPGDSVFGDDKVAA